MRTLGEQAYRDWYVARIQETRVTLYLFCLAGNTLLTAAVGAGIIFFGRTSLVVVAIGLGVVAYAGTVGFYTLLALWRMRRAALREERLRARNAARPDFVKLVVPQGPQASGQ